MSIKDLIKNQFGVVTCDVRGELIRIGGPDTYRLSQALVKTWSTSRIEANMFTKMSRRIIEFQQFFAPDVFYIAQTLLNNSDRYMNKSILKAMIDALKEKTYIGKAYIPQPSMLNPAGLKKFNVSPLPHQAEFIEVYDQKVQQHGLRGYLLPLGVGLGKSLSSLFLMEQLNLDYIVIVSPKNAIYRVWQDTLLTRYNKPQSPWIVADGQPYQGQRYIISHYETLDRVKAEVERLKGRVGIVLDECHNLNEINSKRTQLFVEMSQLSNVHHTLWMSGTPVKALGYECIPLLRSIDPLFNLDAESRFRKIFGRTAGRALDILAHRLGMISYKTKFENINPTEVTDQELNIQIPNGRDFTLDQIKIEMQQFVKERSEYYRDNQALYRSHYELGLLYYERQMPKSEEAEYRRYQDYIRIISRGFDPVLHSEQAKFCNQFELKRVIPTITNKEHRDNFKSARSVVKYVQLKIMGECLGKVLGRKRMECHREMIKHIDWDKIIGEARKKTLIFTSYVQVAKDLTEILIQKGYNPITVHGETNNQLNAMLSEYAKDPRINPAIATYASLSTAVPLTMASTAVFTNAPFRDYEMTQARARVNRLGQDGPVTMVNCYLDTQGQPNISTRSKDIMQWSKDQVAQIMGLDLPDDVATLGVESYYGDDEETIMDLTELTNENYLTLPMGQESLWLDTEAFEDGWDG